MFAITNIYDFFRIDYCANIKGLFKALHCRKIKIKHANIIASTYFLANVLEFTLVHVVY